MSGGYGYDVRSYNNGYSTVAPAVAEKWKKVEYTESDHVARQQPYVPSTGSYVVKSERIIEKVLAPPPPPTLIEYSNVTPVRWGSRVSSPVDDCPRKVEEFVTLVDTEVSSQPPLLRPSHKSEYKQESDRWSRSSSPISPPVGEYGGEENRSPLRPGYLGNKSRVAPVTDYTQNTNSHLKIHPTENNPWVRNSPQSSLLRSANRPQSYSTDGSPQTGYGSYNDYNYKGNEMGKGRVGVGGHSYHYDETPKDYVVTPQLARGDWTRPSPGSWATSTTKITTLTRPTNDINEAVNYLAGSLQQSSLTHDSPQRQYYNTLGQYPKMEHYTDTIDSREAQSRYGNFNGSSTMGMESYATTIDSREALRKYGGATV